MSDAREVAALALALYHGDTDNEDVPRAAAYDHQARAVVNDISDHVREHGPLPLGEDCVVVPTSGDAFDAMVETFINGAFDRGHGSGHAAVKAGLRAALRFPDTGERT